MTSEVDQSILLMIRDISGRVEMAENYLKCPSMTFKLKALITHFSEVHLVHYKEEYGTIVDSLDKGDGLAVLGFFIETG